METKINYGFIGALILLLGFGGVMVLTTEQASHAYVCSTTNAVYVFEKLSSTNKTGYWTENGVQKSAVCKNGIFTKLAIETEKPIPIPEKQVQGIQFSCNQYNCTRIK